MCKAGETMDRIILFDGVCNLCNQSVQFIIKRDRNKNFKFASLQGGTGKRLIKQYQIDDRVDSIVLIENNKYYLKSSAAIRICMQLSGLWNLFAVFLIIPIFMRDFLYDVIAKKRYMWFGKLDSCMLLSPNLKDRFLD